MDPKTKMKIEAMVSVAAPVAAIALAFDKLPGGEVAEWAVIAALAYTAWMGTANVQFAFAADRPAS